MTKKLFITGPLAVSPDKILKDFSFLIEKGKFSESKTAGKAIPLELGKNTVAYPALINAHDHLRGNYLPRVGPGKNQFYLNWLPWDNDLKKSEVYEERSHINIEENYMLSAYKNLLSGVITVHDHFPHEINDPLLKLLPVFAQFDYALAHECSSFDLKWGDGIQVEHDRAIKKNIPFVTHLEEGFDEESQSGVDILKALSCLDEHSVLVHCIGFSEADIRHVTESKAHTIWCPASNLFMFNTTCKIKKFLDSGINVSLGTDSTHTGSINLLEEMKFAHQVYRRLYGEDLSAKTLLQMVTVNPAKALRLENLVGSLTAGLRGDMLITGRKHEDPYENLLHLKIEDIQLLIYAGRPVFGDASYKDLFMELGEDYSEVRINKKKKFLVGKPLVLLKKIWKKIGYEKKIAFLPLEI